MNKVIISGNLTKDMEVNVTKKDVLVGKFTVAVQIGYGDNSKTQFYPVVLFGNRVESLRKYLLKYKFSIFYYTPTNLTLLISLYLFINLFIL